LGKDAEILALNLMVHDVTTKPLSLSMGARSAQLAGLKAMATELHGFYIRGCCEELVCEPKLLYTFTYLVT
jgi:hypothetical protein